MKSFLVLLVLSGLFFANADEQLDANTDTNENEDITSDENEVDIPEDVDSTEDEKENEESDVSEDDIDSIASEHGMDDPVPVHPLIKLKLAKIACSKKYKNVVPKKKRVYLVKVCVFKKLCTLGFKKALKCKKGCYKYAISPFAVFKCFKRCGYRHCLTPAQRRKLRMKKRQLKLCARRKCRYAPCPLKKYCVFMKCMCRPRKPLKAKLCMLGCSLKHKCFSRKKKFCLMKCARTNCRRPSI